MGCERQLAKAERRLGPYAPLHRGVDVDAILQQVRAAGTTVEDGDLALSRVRL